MYQFETLRGRRNQIEQAQLNENNCDIQTPGEFSRRREILRFNDGPYVFQVGDLVEVGERYSFQYAIVTGICKDTYDFSGKTQVEHCRWFRDIGRFCGGGSMWIRDAYMRKLPDAADNSNNEAIVVELECVQVQS